MQAAVSQTSRRQWAGSKVGSAAGSAAALEFTARGNTDTSSAGDVQRAGRYTCRCGQQVWPAAASKLTRVKSRKTAWQGVGRSNKLTGVDWADQVDLKLTKFDLKATMRSKPAESTELTEKLTAEPTWSGPKLPNAVQVDEVNNAVVPQS